MLFLSIVEDISDQIGERLTKAREAAGLTVDDVMFKTRIPRSVIDALEAGDFSVFSSPTYAKSFLSQYSAYLNVDARLWLDALEPAAFIAGEIVRPLWEAANPVRDEAASSPREGNSGWPSALTMLAATGVLVFVALKGYEFFEKRFGLELAVPQPGPDTVSPVSPQPVVAPQAPVAKPGSTVRSADDPPPPPPRAIIVR
ncbi:MAG: hypothetical protein EOP87_07890 [Verrucomicrobiaceae bacterium]|nr:MAG: hypothetical protein EOP87_07890 [Verrucomicrobiaceae bacterium]